MNEKWSKIVEYCNGVAQLCQALAESIEKLSDTEPPSKTETKEEKENITFETVSALAKKKAAAGQSTAVKTIVTESGFKKLSDIPTELYADILKKLEEL